MPRTDRHKLAFKCLLIFLLWTLVGLSFASQFYLSSMKMGRPVSWGQAIAWSLGDWYVWALLSIPVVFLSRRFHLEGKVWRKNLLMHAGASALISLAYIFLRAWIGRWQSAAAGEPVSFSDAFQPLLFKTFHFNIVIYWVIVSVTHAFDYYRQSRERALQTVELEASLTQAKLQSLQMQLNPHFLFNTLNAISTLMHRDIEAADRMIVLLSDLLRAALDHRDSHEVPLRKELEFLERYLEIEQTRFGDRLHVQMRVSPDALDALVPNLFLQPLAENAIQHGIEPHGKRGHVVIRARRIFNHLVLQVSDNGGGLTPGFTYGVGLSNSQSRLEQLYKHQHRFTLRNRRHGGLTVTTTIPFRQHSNYENSNRYRR